MAQPERRSGGEEGEGQKAFGVNEALQALNRADFVKFLENFDDAARLDPEDPDFASTVETRMKSFEGKRRAQAEVKLMAKTEFSKLGLRLEEKDLKEVNEAIETKAAENPEGVLELLEKIEEFKRLKKEVPEAEKQLKELGNADDLWVEKTTLEARQHIEKTRTLPKRERIPLLGKMLRQKSESERKFEKDYGVQLEKIGEELKKIEAGEKKLNEAERLKFEKGSAFEDLRNQLFGELGLLKDIREKAGEKLEKKMYELGDPKRGLAGLEEARRLVEKVRGDDGEPVTLDLLEKITDNPEEYVERLDQAIEIRTYEDMKTELLKPFGSRPLDGVDRALSKFRNKARIGGKTGDEAREFLVESLLKIRDELPTKDLRGTFINIMIWKLRGGGGEKPEPK